MRCMILLQKNKIWFPKQDLAMDDGLLAIGGDLSLERLVLAYENGIFPWYSEGEPPLWWCPDPRFVLYPEELKVSKSMKQILRSDKFEFRHNTAFEHVIRNCKNAPRPGQDGTWISDDVVNAYMNMHKHGYAHSAEAWEDGKLVGGLYGILMDRIFFGESMFSHSSNSSKFAFINWVQYLKSLNVQLIDCQVYTEHLESLGAKMIPRTHFLEILKKNIAK